MGKYAMTHGKRSASAREYDKYGQRGVDYNDPFVRWNMKDTPGIGPMLRADDQTRYWNDYLYNIGKDWSYVRYPALLGGTSMLGAGMSATSLVSRNLMSLYRR